MKKILLVDDDTGFSTLLSEILTEEGYAVLTKPSPVYVPETITTYQPDLLVVDYWLPGERGDKLVQRIKQDPRTAMLPIIVISANHDIEKKVKKAGAEAFIAKPFETEALIQTISLLIHKHSRIH